MRTPLVVFGILTAEQDVDAPRRNHSGGEGCANIDTDLAFADGEHLSCKLPPIAIEQRDTVSDTGPEHAAEVLSDGAL